MIFGIRRVYTMHEWSLLVFIAMLASIFRAVHDLILLIIVLSGALLGIGVGFIFFKFYMRRFKDDTINLRGYRFPHILIYIMFEILGLPVYGSFFVLSENGEIATEIYETVLRIGLGYINGFIAACFLASLITELILLHLLERRSKKILFMDLGGFFQ